MKTQFLILTTVFAMALISCQDNGITGSVSPDSLDKMALNVSGTDVVGMDAEATIPFDFNENVYLTTSIIKAYETRGDNRITVPHIWKITGFGDSEIENYGSWRVDIDLEYNSGNDAITGTISFTFPDYGDEVILVAYGGPILQRNNGQNDQLTMKLALKDGSGRYSQVKFEGGGSLILTTAWQDNGKLETTLNVEGSFIDNGE